MAATKFSFFVISTLDRGDFPRIIVIDLFFHLFISLHFFNTSPCLIFTSLFQHFTPSVLHISFHFFNTSLRLFFTSPRLFFTSFFQHWFTPSVLHFFILFISLHFFNTSPCLFCALLFQHFFISTHHFSSTFHYFYLFLEGHCIVN